MWNISASEWTIAAATLCGPIFAVQAQKWLEFWRRRSDNQNNVFYTLMATRAMRVSAVHVEALNRIDLEFRPEQNWFFQRSTKKCERDVVEAWKQYALHLNTQFDENIEAQRIAFNNTADKLFYNLLHDMSKALKFNFPKSQLMQNAYYPKAHGWREELHHKVLMGAADVLTGKSDLRMAITDLPVSNEALQQQSDVQKSIMKVLESGVAKVQIITNTSRPKRK